MLKKIAISTLLTIIFFGILEFSSYIITKNENKKFKEKAQLVNDKVSNYETNYRLLSPFNTTVYRNSVIKENTENKPIIWFGCSFAEGAGLSDEEEPCYKISELTNRSCINKSKGATGTQFMYYQIKQDSFKKENPEADYIIYTFIWNHLQRLYNYQVNPLLYMHNLRYEIKNDKLKEINPKYNPIYSSYFMQRLLNRIVEIQGNKERTDFKLFNKIMKETLNVSKKLYPNSKFIMLEFPEIFDIPLPEDEIEELESYGIIVVRVKDLLPAETNIKDEKYWLDDKMHPKSEVWDMILQKLKEKYLD